MRRDVFQAIADPQRRAIINLIATKPMGLNAIAENFDISRPAISKHIKILMECGLIVIKQHGRERICSPRLKPLEEVSQWTEQYKQIWSIKLDVLGDFLIKESSVVKRSGVRKLKRK